MILYRNKETKEIFIKEEQNYYYSFLTPLRSLFDNRTILGDMKDFEVINTAPQIDAKSCTKYFTQKEEINFEDFDKQKWNLGDVISVPLKDGSKVDFRVEHINHENGKTYFVSTKTIGECDMKDNNMNDFLDKFERKLPRELLKRMKPIEHINKLGTHKRKVSLLSLVNVKEDVEKYGLNGEDDILFDGMKTEVSRVRGNDNGKTVWYWLDTPFTSNSAYFVSVNYYGGAGYYGASGVNGVVVCFAI